MSLGLTQPQQKWVPGILPGGGGKGGRCVGLTTLPPSRKPLGLYRDRFTFYITWRQPDKNTIRPAKKVAFSFEQNRSRGIVTRLLAGRAGVRTPVQTVRVSSSTSHPDWLWSPLSFLFDWVPGCDIGYSRPSSAKVKNEWISTSSSTSLWCEQRQL
jgi:hypothetical protein